MSVNISMGESFQDYSLIQDYKADFPNIVSLEFLNLPDYNRCNLFEEIIWALTRENLSFGVCEQHRGRPACTSAQSDQRLCYSLIGKYHI